MIPRTHVYKRILRRIELLNTLGTFPIRRESTTAEFLLIFQQLYIDSCCRATEWRHNPAIVAGQCLDLAAVSVECMKCNGVVFRSERTPGYGDDDRLGGVGVDEVLRAIDSERNYQNDLPARRIAVPVKEPQAYLVVFEPYLRRAFKSWTYSGGDNAEFQTLDNVRKLGGIMVRALEDCNVEPVVLEGE